MSEKTPKNSPSQGPLDQEARASDQQSLSQGEQRKKVIKLQEKLAKDGKKIIPLPSVPEQLHAKLSKGVSELKRLKADILSKREHITAQNNRLKELVVALTNSKSVSFNQADQEKSERSIAYYLDLLDKISQDIDAEINYYSRYLEAEHPKLIIVWEKDLPHGVLFLLAKTKCIAKYIKTIKKDVTISFSRYSFGFDRQIKTMEQAQQYVEQVRALQRIHGY